MSFPPTLSSVLGTNYVPSASEIVQLKAQVQDWDQVVADLDRDLNALQQVQQHLSRQRERFLLSKRKYEALLEPIRRVPDDILAAVFLECLPQEPEGWAAMTPTEGTKHPAITLTHVCRHWRNLAMGTPRLWAQVDLRVPSRPYRARTIPRLTHLVRVFTQRSRACPMTIKVKMDTGESGPMFYRWGNTDGYEVALKELVDEVCISSERWRSLSLSAILDPERGNLPLLQFFTAIAKPLPGLTQVHFEVTFETQERERQVSRLISICPKVLSGPALRSVSITKPSGRLSNHSFNIGLPWAGVRNDGVAPEMANFGITSRVALELLRSLPSLVHFDVDIDYMAEEGEEELLLAGAAESTELPFLQSLSLKGLAVSPGFATSLTLPSLQSVSFTAVRLSSREQQEAGLLQCLSRFGDHITTFELDMAPFSEAFILACAQSLNRVTKLKIGDSKAFDLDKDPALAVGFGTSDADLLTLWHFLYHITPDFSHHLKPQPHEQIKYCAPNLREFTFWWTNADHRIALEMVDFISARFAAGRDENGAPHLKRVVVRFPNQRRSTGLLDIKPELITRGVDFGLLDLELEEVCTPVGRPRSSYILPEHIRVYDESELGFHTSPISPTSDSFAGSPILNHFPELPPFDLMTLEVLQYSRTTFM
ncbi:hypothetical protein DFP72DRAFT_1040410 [Ephemerocybe angulata]|uniref:F-box domain-containing protein n=1 Tax=Ephemerocybe angulata TaxID=980116 RepID=A0A8H6MFP0_9AGAR|nr:hypothetical protein DFP72DRAFT_1040410 [Tulosesus angulatus]